MRARGLRGESHSNVVSIAQEFELIDTEEAVQKARDIVQKSKQVRAEPRRNRTRTEELAEPKEVPKRYQTQG